MTGLARPCIPVDVFMRDERDALQHALRTRPATSRWRMLAEGWMPLVDAEAIAPLVFSGCACCTGQLALHVLLRRVLRGGDVDRIVLLLNDRMHLVQSLAVLHDAQYAAWVTLERIPEHDVGTRRSEHSNEK